MMIQTGGYQRDGQFVFLSHPTIGEFPEFVGSAVESVVGSTKERGPRTDVQSAPDRQYSILDTDT